MYNEDRPMPTNPKEIEANMKPWVEWMDGLAKKGQLEAGLPVNRNGKSVTTGGVSDYKAQKVDLGGYIIINANSMDEAVKIAQSSPHAKMGMGTTTVRECMSMEM